MPLYTKRILPDVRWFNAILDAVKQFEDNAATVISDYSKVTAGLPVTDRIVDIFEEMRI